MEFINMPIPVERFTDVCAVLAGVKIFNLTTREASSPAAAPVDPAAEFAAPEFAKVPVDGAPEESGELDAAGWPWSPDMHASTRGKTKEGLWRMKIGVSRPDPKPGFPKETADEEKSAGDISTQEDGAVSTSEASVMPGPADPAIDADEEDEFAAFKAAADKANAVEASAAENVPARKWTDADLGMLCNQAATKLNDPAPIKAIIAKFVPDDAVPHSRNIPAERREEFAQAIEAKAGIEFAG